MRWADRVDAVVHRELFWLRCVWRYLWSKDGAGPVLDMVVHRRWRDLDLLADALEEEHRDRSR